MLKPLIANIKLNLIAERQRWLLWLPVFFGVGIGVYFGLSFEPSLYLVFAVIIFTSLPLLIFRGNFARFLLLMAGLGFAVAWINTQYAKSPVIYKLDHKVTVSGNIEWISVSSGFPTLMLDNLRIDELDKKYIPEELKLNVRSKFKQELRPGDRVIANAMLSPPGRPSMPGGYDFARAAYFSGTGANGYAVGPVTKLKLGGEEDWLANMRYNISNKIRASLPGDTGAMTDAVITGDRSRISKEAYDDMRKSGLAHLIAISGINLVLAAGVMFFGVRLLLSFFPVLSERYAAKKIAAVVAILGETIYLLISGMPVSAVRSYIMVLLVMLGIVVDRDATPMRSVALSSLIILAFAPESMLGPSFQMSYAATIALISVYEIFARRFEAREEKMFSDHGKQKWHYGLLRKVWLYPVTVMSSSFVAGLATAPYSAYHFNQFVNYGLPANLVAIPLTSFIVMPFSVIGMVLMPLGLQDIGLVPAGWGTYLTLVVAHYVGNLPNSSVHVPQIATWGLVAATLGGLWFLIWQGKWRYYGFILIFIGIFLSPLTVAKPDIIIHENGHLFAINYNGTLYFNTKRSSNASKAWLKFFAQGEQVKLPKQEVYDLGEHKLILNDENCAYLIDKTCITLVDLEKNGTHNIYLKTNGITVETVEERRGKRLWTLN